MARSIKLKLQNWVPNLLRDMTLLTVDLSKMCFCCMKNTSLPKNKWKNMIIIKLKQHCQDVKLNLEPEIIERGGIKNNSKKKKYVSHNANFKNCTLTK